MTKYYYVAYMYRKHYFDGHDDVFAYATIAIESELFIIVDIITHLATLSQTTTNGLVILNWKELSKEEYEANNKGDDDDSSNDV